MAPNPYSLAGTITHPLARMLPLFKYQSQVYRLGEKEPPAGDMFGHGPVWESMSFVLDQRGTLQARVNLQRDFTLLAITSAATVRDNGGFRIQFFDTRKQRLFSERMVQRPNFAGV